MAAMSEVVRFGRGQLDQYKQTQLLLFYKLKALKTELNKKCISRKIK
jgi:hypothetical protein